jgi:hypothetical protein
MGNAFMVPLKVLSDTNVSEALGEHIERKGSKVSEC